ncbi:MAG: methylenetetrahydrofolate reductase [NAD(P)H] [Gammaproteobacteria bacterium]|nr:methylenetetrahydrofolate reductase [NAD(P)H] [Gammaproteobacteria bacterium]NIR82003.1 methylenetetrahydrofolate reductase [NAD(P)H] [Gammaproteobacteria bacterium]NIR89063.1 methylenetetrahydrofolate reductase [NAD(P)H] [Gammaproteobacteria bacterium]NIU03110.1 methylenetetrahydrofolate reductase [NAD(P)H] [Gammaproteobacteria bacterium]NIX84385.1 methylenetetrahydrofolate reductase [NAD(P)H] [Gammaproteobacteria bacterium]
MRTPRAGEGSGTPTRTPWCAQKGLSAVPPAPGPDIDVSFEFFPPKTPEMEQTLWSSIERLAVLQPRFVSVTYGAGGSTRERTHATVRRVLEETSLVPAAHLTCVAATCAEVDAVARGYWDAGIRHIVALRGDPPGDDNTYRPHPRGYPYAAELVSGLKRIAPFELSVAAYPEVHPDAPSPQADLDNLKRKIDAGAVRAITQFFFDNDLYFRFIDRVRAAGIDVPVVPGILPVTSVKGLLRFAASCGAGVPRWVTELFDGLDQDPQTRRLVAATVAAEQCTRLREQGVREFHFYTLNRAELTYAVCHMLGLRPVEPQPPADAPEWRARA